MVYAMKPLSVGSKWGLKGKKLYHILETISPKSIRFIKFCWSVNCLRNLTFDRTRSPVFKKSLYFIPGKFRINRDILLITRLILLDMDFD